VKDFCHDKFRGIIDIKVDAGDFPGRIKGTAVVEFDSHQNAQQVYKTCESRPLR
jgi:hypothetical protein